jgi:hypothetical protein
MIDLAPVTAPRRPCSWRWPWVLMMAVLGATGPAAAAELRAPLKTCTGLDCQATVIPGFINGWTAGGNLNVAPWVAQVFAARHECLRLHVTSQAVDTELVVIAASGKAYRNNSGNVAPCPTCPLVKFATGSVGGWHTVQVSQAAGAVVNASFTLAYGRYDAGNPNCATPTQPVP